MGIIRPVKSSPGQRSAGHRDQLPLLHRLWQLLNHAGPQTVRMLWSAIIFSGLAAAFDVGSLLLLNRAVHSLSRDEASAFAPNLAIFIVVAVVATMLRMRGQTSITSTQYGVMQNLSIKAFAHLQLQDYQSFLREGGSAGFAVFDRLNLISFQVVAPFISLIVALLSSLTMIAALLWLYPLIGIVFALLSLLIAIEASRDKSAPGDDQMPTLIEARAAIVYEARHAFRDIFLTNGQLRLSEDFNEVETSLRSTQARAIVTAQSSRQVLEIAGAMLLFLFLLLVNSLPHLQQAMLPMIAVLALASLRLTPHLALLRSSYRMLRVNGALVEDVHQLFERPVEAPATSPDVPVPQLNRELLVSGVGITRPDRAETLSQINLRIARGARVGIRGASGSGKSTLLDLICGAIETEAGDILIDDVKITGANSAAWRQRIGMVSQAPILLGHTLYEAIIFPDRPDAADQSRVDQAIAQAGISAMIENFPKRLDTPVGEGIAFLSGGQKQRLALAHALYRAHDLLLLDEATGQLDAESEALIIDTLRTLPRSLTIIIVSHREAAFDFCDQVYELRDGRLYERVCGSGGLT